MLKPVLDALINFFLLDYLLANVLFAGFAFAFDVWYAGPEDSTLTKMHGAGYWQYWVQFVVGAALAFVMRAALYREYGLGIWPLFSMLKQRLLLQRASAALLAFFALAFYRVRITDPGGSLGEPFSSGILASAAMFVGVLFFFEVTTFVLGTIEQPATASIFSSRYVALALLGLAVIIVDLLAFSHGQWIALLLIGGVVLLFFIGAVYSVLR